MDSLEKEVTEGLKKGSDEFGIVEGTTFNQGGCVVSAIMGEVESIDEKPEITEEEYHKANALEELFHAALKGVNPANPETKEEYVEAMNSILKS